MPADSVSPSQCVTQSQTAGRGFPGTDRRVHQDSYQVSNQVCKAKGTRPAGLVGSHIVPYSNHALNFAIA